MSRRALVLAAMALACSAPPPRPLLTRPEPRASPGEVRPAPSAPVAAGSAPVTPLASASAPAAAPPPSLDLLDEADYRTPPAAVTAELAHLEQNYEALPPLERLPDFLSVNDVLALVPEAAGERDSLRDRIHNGEKEVLLGRGLDDEQRLFVLWIAGNLTQVLAVFDGERLASKAVIQRGRPRLGHVLDEKDGERPELLVEHITSMSACCYPASLDVYRVGKRGALSKVLSFPKSHSEVGPGVRWGFMNHFEFGAGRVIVTRVHPPDDARYEFVFDARAGRYLPTAATTKRLADERAAQAAAGDD